MGWYSDIIVGKATAHRIPYNIRFFVLIIAQSEMLDSILQRLYIILFTRLLASELDRK